MTESPTASRRGFLAGSLAAGAVGAASPLLWVPPADAAVRARGVHLTYGADATRRMAVSWSTPTSVKKPRLDLAEVIKGKAHWGHDHRADSRSSYHVDTVYHHVDLHGLRPDTTYKYRISHGGGSAVTGTFTTAPKKHRPFRFVTFGDMGVNGDAAKHVALIRKQKPELAFVVGDLCYADSSGGTGTGGDSTQDMTLWDKWLNQIGPSAASIPWMTTVGNHEMEANNGELGYNGYLDRFTLPGNGPKEGHVTYSFTHGNVAFIALDGNDASAEISRNNGYLGSKQDAWLVARLTEFRERDDIDFIVVGFHNCMYCTNLVHASDGGNRSRWEPIFDQFSVDLVVNGHNHCYERTHPMRDGAPVTEAAQGAVIDSAAGTTYLTAGGGGAAAYPTGGLPMSYVTMDGGIRVPEATLWSAVQDAVHSVAFIDVTPRNKSGVATMKLRALATDGSLLDTVTLKRTTKQG